MRLRYDIVENKLEVVVATKKNMLFADCLDSVRNCRLVLTPTTTNDAPNLLFISSNYATRYQDLLTTLS